MRKGKYITANILLACLAAKKTKPGIQVTDESLEKLCKKADKKKAA